MIDLQLAVLDGLRVFETFETKAGALETPDWTSNKYLVYAYKRGSAEPIWANQAYPAFRLRIDKALEAWDKQGERAYVFDPEEGLYNEYRCFLDLLETSKLNALNPETLPQVCRQIGFLRCLRQKVAMNRSGVLARFFVPRRGGGRGGGALVEEASACKTRFGRDAFNHAGFNNRELALKPEINPKSLKPNPESLKPKPPNPTKAILRETLNLEP